MKLTKVVLSSFFIVYLFSGSLKAQVGNSFPDISGSTLTDIEVNLPKDSQGKFTLIGMAYSKKAEDDLKSWYSPVYNTFVHKSSSPSLFEAVNYNVNLYFIPMFTGVNQAVSGKVTKKMKENVDPQLQPYVMVFAGKLEEYKKVLDFEKKDTPYFFVLDKSGKIIYATSGKYSEAKMEQIEELIEE